MAGSRRIRGPVRGTAAPGPFPCEAVARCIYLKGSWPGRRKGVHPAGERLEDVPCPREGPRLRTAPGPVLPCADPEPRAPRATPGGPISPSGPLPDEDLPPAAAVNRDGVSLV